LTLGLAVPSPSGACLGAHAADNTLLHKVQGVRAAECQKKECHSTIGRLSTTEYLGDRSGSGFADTVSPGADVAITWNASTRRCIASRCCRQAASSTHLCSCACTARVWLSTLQILRRTNAPGGRDYRTAISFVCC
jgi:hypothetical protein